MKSINRLCTIILCVSLVWASSCRASYQPVEYRPSQSQPPACPSSIVDDDVVTQRAEAVLRKLGRDPAIYEIDLKKSSVVLAFILTEPEMASALARYEDLRRIIAGGCFAFVGVYPGGNEKPGIVSPSKYFHAWAYLFIDRRSVLSDGVALSASTLKRLDSKPLKSRTQAGGPQ